MATQVNNITFSLPVIPNLTWAAQPGLDPALISGTFAVGLNPAVPISFNVAIGGKLATLSAPIPFGFLSSGTYNFEITAIGRTNPAIEFPDGTLGNATVTLATTPVSQVFVPLTYSKPTANTFISGNADVFVSCLHGSSLVKMKEGVKRIDQIEPGDEVLTGKNLDEYTKVKSVPRCWLSFLGVDHDAIIFEKDSLGPNQPEEQLIIDPGHPICTKEDYFEQGHDALRPAGSYWEELKGDKIYNKKWTDIYVQEEPSVRYDLILEGDYNTYVANGLVVESAVYKDHRYKQFV